MRHATYPAAKNPVAAKRPSGKRWGVAAFLLILACLIGIGGLFMGGVFKGDRPVFMAAKPEKGFHYGYYYYIPQSVKHVSAAYLLVEPNNTGISGDSPSLHKQSARLLIERRRKWADALECILLVPVFDRPKSNALMYTHALDRDTLLNHTGMLARVDLQLICMIDDIKEVCRDKGITVEPKILMHGFSASGTFANRFTALHPELVQAVASGGVNAMPILPLDSMEKERLIYPVGIADLAEIAGTAFDLEQYTQVPQLIYMGTEDYNDTLPYSDAFSAEERELILRVLGADMHARWEISKQLYEKQGCSAELITYDGIGHTITDTMQADIIGFLKRSVP